MSDTNLQLETVNPERRLVRILVRSLYDIQKLRIESGNRLIATTRAKLGIEPGSDDSPDILETLKLRYKRLTDGVAEMSRRLSNGESDKDSPLPAQKKISRRRKFDFDGVISNYTELRLVDHYLELCREENRLRRDLEKALEGMPIYDRFLSRVRGVGPQMAGVIISELDIHEGQYPTSFWRYAGLDVVHCWYVTEENGEPLDTPRPLWKDGELLEPPSEAEMASNEREATLYKVVTKYTVVSSHEETAYVEGEVVDSLPAQSTNMLDGTYVYEHPQGDVEFKEVERREAEVKYRKIARGRSKRREHMERTTYIDSEGEEQERLTITFNPFLKTKLVGVLSTSFLRAGTKDNPYREVYDNYRNRLDKAPRHDSKSDGHKHNMALRYMVKEFLADLHTAWSCIEGITPVERYKEAKLGMYHTKNELVRSIVDETFPEHLSNGEG